MSKYFTLQDNSFGISELEQPFEMKSTRRAVPAGRCLLRSSFGKQSEANDCFLPPSADATSGLQRH